MFKLTSNAFADGAAIPVPYTCDGQDISPPLDWSGAPGETAAFALILNDPDAAGFVHWVVADLPPEATGILEGASRQRLSGVEGTSSFGAVGYGGPCPPSGTHRYVFTLYALDGVLGSAVGVTSSALRDAMEGRVLDEAVLTGTYAR
jgi:Raf kinase inhibitor-like YbhB/YbcL family protein